MQRVSVVEGDDAIRSGIGSHLVEVALYPRVSSDHPMGFVFTIPEHFLVLFQVAVGVIDLQDRDDLVGGLAHHSFPFVASSVSSGLEASQSCPPLEWARAGAALARLVGGRGHPPWNRCLGL